MHVMRRKLVDWLRRRASQHELDGVMESVVRVCASTDGAPAETTPMNKWAYVAGERNRGRFTLHSLRGSVSSNASHARKAKKGAAGKPEGSRTDAVVSTVADSAAVSTSSPASATASAATAAATAVTAAAAERKSAESSCESIPEVSASSELVVEVDVQVMQLTLKASHPQTLPSEVARLKDVVDVFGDVSMQACLTEQTVARQCYRLVGRDHDIAY
eukprot:6188969-Pleurochrysis_carterae.AAC.1